MEEKIEAIFRAALDLDETIAVTDTMSMATEENWDSLAQMSIIINLKKEFSIPLSFEEVLQMNSLGSIKRIVKAKCKEDG